ncbi:MAG TPA: DUF4129 domain-containing protein [Actinocrinis sp.]|nr:DUF4129 domain-containing protein [Actinocrinis sp.]
MGLHAAAGSALRNGGTNGGIAFALGCLFGIGALVAATKYRGHMRTTEVPTTALDRLRTATAAVLFAAAVLVPLALMLLHRNNDDTSDDLGPLPPSPGSSAQSNPGPQKQIPRPTNAHGGLHINLGVLLLVLVLIVAAIALVAAIVLALRLLRSVPPSGAISSAAPAPEAGIEDEALADALAAGRSALEGDDARAAIIACYAAMEDSLGDAGVTRELSDSPTDLLRRATARDAVDRSAAAALTVLFREARYSTHPLHQGHLTAAREALDTITASITESLARRAEAVEPTTANAVRPANPAHPTNPARAR